MSQTKQPPESWYIDVCATCAHHAKWPFCEHYRSDRRWTVGVLVRPAHPGSHRRNMERAQEASRAA